MMATLSDAKHFWQSEARLKVTTLVREAESRGVQWFDGRNPTVALGEINNPKFFFEFSRDHNGRVTFKRNKYAYVSSGFVFRIPLDIPKRV